MRIDEERRSGRKQPKEWWASGLVRMIDLEVGAFVKMDCNSWTATLKMKNE